MSLKGLSSVSGSDWQEKEDQKQIQPLENCERKSERTVDKIPVETDYMSLREIGSTRLCIIH